MTMMGICEQKGDMDTMKMIFQQSKQHQIPLNVGMLNNLLKGCVISKDLNAALAYWEEFRSVSPTLISFTPLLSLCAAQGRPDLFNKYFQQLSQRNLRPNFHLFRFVLITCLEGDADIPSIKEFYSTIRSHVDFLAKDYIEILQLLKNYTKASSLSHFFTQELEKILPPTYRFPPQLPKLDAGKSKTTDTIQQQRKSENS